MIKLSGTSLKAFIGALLAGLTAAGTAAADGHFSAQELIGVAVATVAVFGGVWGTSNAPAVPAPATTEPPK